MKRLIFMAVLAISSLLASAQDIIVRYEGKVEGKVIAVTDSYVKYKTSDDPNSPIISEPISNMYYIRYADGRLQSFDNEPNSSEKTYKKVTRFEVDLYVQNGWGVGFKLSSEITPFVGCNFGNISYKTGFNNPRDAGILNVRPFGLRFYTPLNNNIRVFTETNLGYSMFYVSEQEYNVPGFGDITIEGNMFHFFGLGFTAGLQFCKRFAVGYNLDFYKNSDWELLSNWGTISFLF